MKTASRQTVALFALTVLFALTAAGTCQAQFKNPFKNTPFDPGTYKLPAPPPPQDSYIPDTDPPGPRPTPVRSTIQVSFRNGTQYQVRFHLNGGRGLDTSINPGKTVNYTMLVDSGITSVVGINQFNGTRQSFTVANGGSYEFKMQGQEIRNFSRK